jgi:hypothetical protein
MVEAAATAPSVVTPWASSVARGGLAAAIGSTGTNVLG